jgi:hypothetical protein
MRTRAGSGDRRTLQRYLLGELTDTARAQVEELLFNSDGCFARLCQLEVDMTPDVNPASLIIPVTFVVGPGVGPALAIDKLSLSFPFPRAESARSQKLTVSSMGGGTLNFTTVINTSTAGNWLLVAPASCKAQPALPSILTVSADARGLAPSTYTGHIGISSDGGNQTVPVTTISNQDQAIPLSQTGLVTLEPASFVLSGSGRILFWRYRKSRRESEF